MPSYRTIRPKNENIGKTATDIHISTVDPANPKPNQPKLNVKGVDGKAPSDPNTSYGLNGHGSDTIDIDGINVGTGGELNIRLESDANEFPKLYYRWTPQSEFGTTMQQIVQTSSVSPSKNG